MNIKAWKDCPDCIKRHNSTPPESPWGMTHEAAGVAVRRGDFICQLIPCPTCAAHFAAVEEELRKDRLAYGAFLDRMGWVDQFQLDIESRATKENQ